MLQRFEPKEVEQYKDMKYTKDDVSKYDMCIKRIPPTSLIAELTKLVPNMNSFINSITMVTGAFIDTIDALKKDFRSHEFPVYVKHLFTSLDTMISKHLLDTMLEKVHSNDVMLVPKNISTHQILFLIDPNYSSRRLEPLQLIYKLMSIESVTYNILNQCFYNKSNFISNTGEIVYINSKLQVIIVPENIDIQLIKQVVNMNISLNYYYPHLLYVMDCTSMLTQKMYVQQFDSSNRNYNVFYTKSDCLIEDSNIDNVPMITVNGECIDSKIGLRYLNLQQDTIIYYQSKEDDYSRRCYNFLKMLKKKEIVSISLVGLYKLWTFFNMKRTYFSKILKIEINCFEIGYVDFLQILKETEFMELLNNCVGIYYSNEIIHAISIIKYTIKKNMNIIRMNNSMNNICKLAILNILNDLEVLFPDMNIPFYKEDTINRVFVAEFLNSQNIYL